MKKQRLFALLLCAVIASASLFSLLLIAEEAGHDCAGENCPVCACIRRAAETLRQIGTGTEGTALPAFAAVFAAAPCVRIFRFGRGHTLITKKVKLND